VQSIPLNHAGGKANSPRTAAFRMHGRADRFRLCSPLSPMMLPSRHLLGDRLGHEIDVVERDSLKPLLRDAILTDAETMFG
jgi:hypothetical protein